MDFSEMRDFLLEVIILGDDNDCISEVAQSLRFSTHCNIKVILRKIQNPGLTFYNRIKYIKYSDEIKVRDAIDNADLIYKIKEEKIFVFTKEDIRKDIKQIFFSYPENMQLSELVDGVSKIKSKQIDRILKRYFKYELGLSYELDSTSEYIFMVDFINDFSHETLIIATSLKKISGYENSFHFISNKLSNYLEKILLENIEVDISSLHFQISVSVDSAFNTIRLYRSYSYDHWSLLRSVGINIPLIIMQNQLRRKLKIVPMIDLKDIFWSKSLNKPQYSFTYNTVFVDLDETLMINGVIVDEVYNYLVNARSVGKTLILITRHKYNIEETLNAMNIEMDFFSEIVKVEDGEVKSDFIKGQAIFIDNEFPERLDVRSKLGVPVLDINQIEFFNLENYVTL